jgi:uncharacterized repeat protein (TIGR01451 family)
MKETIFYTFTIINNTGTSLDNVSFTDNLANGGLFFSNAMEATNGIQITGQPINNSKSMKTAVTVLMMMMMDYVTKMMRVVSRFLLKADLFNP